VQRILISDANAKHVCRLLLGPYRLADPWRPKHTEPVLM